jgi:hypothetical protein
MSAGTIVEVQMRPFVANYAACSVVREIEKFPELISVPATLDRYAAALKEKILKPSDQTKKAMKFGMPKEVPGYQEHNNLLEKELERITNHKR